MSRRVKNVLCSCWGFLSTRMVICGILLDQRPVVHARPGMPWDSREGLWGGTLDGKERARSNGRYVARWTPPGQHQPGNASERFGLQGHRLRRDGERSGNELAPHSKNPSQAPTASYESLRPRHRCAAEGLGEDDLPVDQA